MQREYKDKTVTTRTGDLLTVVSATLGSKPSEDLITLSNGKTYQVGIATASGFLRFADEAINEVLQDERAEEQRRAQMAEEAERRATQEERAIQEAYEQGLSDAITSFRGEYRFLSNFYPADVAYNGITYHNNESAFQAQKDPSRAHEFALLTNPVQAKRNGRKVHLRSDWEKVKVGIMEEIVRAKFEQNPDLAEKLLATGNQLLIEGGTDNFWGNKRNALGKILMKIRLELRYKNGQ